MEAPDKKPRCSWRNKCIEAFGLQLLPENMKVTEGLQKIAHDESAWEEYFKHRSNIEVKCSPLDEAEDDGRRDATLEEKWKKCVNSVAEDLDMKEWIRHIKFCAEGDWEDYDIDLRRGVYDATIFSPYAIPRAVQLKHHYYNRSFMSKVDFSCEWKFELVRFDGANSNGDAIQRNLAKLYSKGFVYPSPAFYEDEDGRQMEVICRYVDAECIRNA